MACYGVDIGNKVYSLGYKPIGTQSGIGSLDHKTNLDYSIKDPPKREQPL